MNVIDLFSGGGGLTEGFVKEGYNIIAHIEKDKWACETLKTRIIYHFLKEKNDMKLYNEYLKEIVDYKNPDQNREKIFNKYPEVKQKIECEVLNFTFGNISDDKNATDIDIIIKAIKRAMKFNKVRKIDLIIGGPPCQAYSLVGRGVLREKVESDKRNYLFRYYKKVVETFSPSAFVFENVPGIITAKNGEIIKAIKSEFEEIGYKLLSGKNKNTRDNIINCIDLNIPQGRKRVILFGFKKELNLEYPNIYKYKYNFKSITTKDTIGDLPSRSHNHGKYGEFLRYPKNREQSEFQKLMRMDSNGITLHQTRKHNERDLENYKDVIRAAQIGKKLVYTELPEERRTHKNQKSFIDRYKVHWWESVPHTILAHLAKDGHYNIHPDIRQCRSLTVREAARIQTFPDNYYFEGPRTAQFTQVGNAVPPLMAEVIAKAIKELL